MEHVRIHVSYLYKGTICDITMQSTLDSIFLNDKLRSSY